MKYFFENTEKQDQLERILVSWIGTPYRHQSGVKGMGTDCVHFIARVFEEMGFGPFRIPRYSKGWHFHQSSELLLEGILQQMNVEKVRLLEPASGDIFLFKYGKTNSHAAIFHGDYLYQALNEGVLKLHWLDERWNKRKRYALRIY